MKQPLPSLAHQHSSNSNSCSRRSFIQHGAYLTLLPGMLNLFPGSLHGEEKEASTWYHHRWDPDQDFLIWGTPLRLQPILMYTIAQKREMTSWKSWGGVLDEDSASNEVERINKELRSLKDKAEFPLEILPIRKVKEIEAAASVSHEQCDAVLLFPASGSGRLLQSCVPPNKDTLLFVRHRSGPTYYWYEALSTAYLQTDRENVTGEQPRLGQTHVDDVIVDDYEEVLWRLRSLYGIKNLRSSRMIALGGVWGKYAPDAPEIAREKFNIHTIDITYDEFAPRIQRALADRNAVSRAEDQADRYLSLPNTTLETEKAFVVNAFVLYDLFKEVMLENRAPAFTIKECMSTIIPMAKTTACLSLGLLNDDGLIAFCESDYVVIPAGLLLRHIASSPVFLHNSTFPHKGIVTCAHCSAPRRMDSRRYEPARIMTHEESDYGAAPKVEIPIGQEVTFINPEYTQGRWVGFRGNVEDNPFLPICRSQQDVRIQGDWKKLLAEVRDSHWLMVYGNYLHEVGYAARKLGLRWDNISDLS